MNSAAEHPVFVFAGGGTGGHLYPGLAVAEALQSLCPRARIVFACSDRAIDQRILQPTPYGIVVQPVKPLPHSPLAACKFLWTWASSMLLAGRLIGELKPAAVLGLGGFAAGPMVKQAARWGLRTALLNPDAVPGKANQFLAKRVEAIFTQFAATTECFPIDVRARVRSVGCPIRSAFVRNSSAAADALRREALQYFGLRDDRKTLLVVGGSLGAATINDAIAALDEDLTALAGQWQMLHITGQQATGNREQATEERHLAPGTGHQEAEDRRTGIPDTETTTASAESSDGLAASSGNSELGTQNSELGIRDSRLATRDSQSPVVRRLAYCDRMDLAYSVADVALARSGAGVVAELTATGTPSVLMPYPYHKDQQQELNAAGLAQAGAALVCQDAKDALANAAHLRETLISLMKDIPRLEAMRHAARGMGHPHAARDVAKWLLDGRG